VSRSQQPHKRFLMRLYWNNWRIQPKTSNEALNGMLRQAGRSPVSRSPVVRAGGGYVPADCDPAVRLNRLRATATASLHGEAWQGKGPALLTIWSDGRECFANPRANFPLSPRQRAKQIYSSFFLYERIVGVRRPLHKN
jgi:hypothetical protein